MLEKTIFPHESKEKKFGQPSGFIYLLVYLQHLEYCQIYESQKGHRAMSLSVYDHLSKGLSVKIIASNFAELSTF